MKNNKKSLVNVIITIIFILVLIVLATPTLFNNLKFGLDLQGGFEVLYQVESIDGKELTADMVTSTYKTMLKRIDVLGVSEPVITVEGDDKIRVQLAGVTDKESAREILSKAANLTFRDTSDNLLMTSDVLTGGGAKVGQDNKGLPAVSLSVADKNEFYKVTKAISEAKDNRIVIWLDYEEGKDSFEKEQDKCGSLNDSRCLSVASVSQGFASDVIIQGNFTTEEVTTLVELINSGSLPTKLNEISSKTVDASFGADSLETTFLAGIIGLILIIILMISLYHVAGLIASIGLIIYTFLAFFIFWLVGGVLTLPGIAAMLLGIGMAVDANVINFSRIKDELKIRKDLKAAYKKGNTASFKTVIDANLTTLIVAIILFIFGESSVKGFATMLIISIVTTLFVMVYLVKIILNKLVESGKFDDKINLFIGFKEKKERKHIDYLKNMRIFLSVTVIIVILGIVSLIFNGLNLGVEFKGGTAITVKSSNELKIDDIKNDIKDFEYNLASIDSDTNTVDIVISDHLTKEQIEETEKYFEDKYSASTDIDVISNVVKQELIKNAILSILFAAIGIVIYISFRFKFSYAISGLVALFHDLLLMLIVFSLCKLEVSTIFIAAILSIIGYSINNTIVTFDKIKETIKDKYSNKVNTKEELKDIVNTSIRNTMIRSIVTTLTTLIPVICLIIFGSREILNFNLAFLVGLIAGLYSSLFLAGSIWYLITKNNLGKKPKKKWYEINELEEKKVKGVNS